MGRQDHVRQLFDGTGIVLEFATRDVPFAAVPSAEDAVAWNEENFGPTIMLRALPRAAGQVAGVPPALLDLYDPTAEAEYLVVTGRKDG